MPPEDEIASPVSNDTVAPTSGSGALNGNILPSVDSALQRPPGGGNTMDGDIIAAPASTEPAVDVQTSSTGVTNVGALQPIAELEGQPAAAEVPQAKPLPEQDIKIEMGESAAVMIDKLIGVSDGPAIATAAGGKNISMDTCKDAMLSENQGLNADLNTAAIAAQPQKFAMAAASETINVVPTEVAVAQPQVNKAGAIAI